MVDQCSKERFRVARQRNASGDNTNTSAAVAGGRKGKRKGRGSFRLSRKGRNCSTPSSERERSSEKNIIRTHWFERGTSTAPDVVGSFTEGKFRKKALTVLREGMKENGNLLSRRFILFKGKKKDQHQKTVCTRGKVFS